MQFVVGDIVGHVAEEESDNGSEGEDEWRLSGQLWGERKDRESSGSGNNQEGELGEAMNVERIQDINPQEPARILFQQVEFNEEEKRKGTGN